MGPNLGGNVELSLEKKTLKIMSPKSKKKRVLIWDVKLLLAYVLCTNGSDGDYFEE
jgi:hypothetical protein